MPVPFFKLASEESLQLDLSGSNGLLVAVTDNGNYHLNKDHFLFRTTNTVDLGAENYLFKNVYAGTVSASSSDERLKEQIAAIPNAVLDAWGDVNWCQFKFRDAVAEKGDASARLHVGIIAQHIISVFEERGLDACDYGLVCHGEWDAEEAKTNENGEVVEPAKPAGDIWLLRYGECLAMEAACQRRRLDQIEARLNEISGNGPATSGASPDNI